MKILRTAILGQGRSGRDIHAANLRHLKDKFEIAAIVEPLAKRQERAEQEYGCTIYSDYKELFGQADKIDLVVNAAPSHFHVPVTLDLLKNGFNVLAKSLWRVRRRTLIC